MVGGIREVFVLFQASYFGYCFGGGMWVEGEVWPGMELVTVRQSFHPLRRPK